jgi:hypothetical protein
VFVSGPITLARGWPHGGGEWQLRLVLEIFGALVGPSRQLRVVLEQGGLERATRLEAGLTFRSGHGG